MSNISILIYCIVINYIIFTASCIIMCYDRKREDFWMKLAVVSLISMIITSLIGIIVV
jgi:hypothetical protein